MLRPPFLICNLICKQQEYHCSNLRFVQLLAVNFFNLWSLIKICWNQKARPNNHSSTATHLRKLYKLLVVLQKSSPALCSCSSWHGGGCVFACVFIWTPHVTRRKIYLVCLPAPPIVSPQLCWCFSTINLQQLHSTAAGTPEQMPKKKNAAVTRPIIK